MTMSGYSSAIVDVMLGWLKGLANWVLRLFNLAGSVTASPLLWLSKNWSKLLIFFLVLGVVLDRLIWLIRWRPYWVWFKKERVIVNDDRFFASADMDKATSRESELMENWDEHDYVVASTVVRRRQADRNRAGKGGQAARARSRSRVQSQPRKRTDARVERHVARDAKAASAPALQSSREAQPAESRREKPSDNIFARKLTKQPVSDAYEDEVFNVANLPAPGEADEEGKRAKRG